MRELALPRRILVVDDEEDVQILVSRILRDVGYEVESAHDGAEAIGLLGRRRPDLVVLDLMMPGVDGWGVLRHMRSLRDAPPVVVMTARADYDTFSRGVNEGAAAYVFKPFRFHELVATCQRVLLASESQPAAVPQERRRDSRRRLLAEVRVLSRDRHPIALGALANISRGGAQVELAVPLEPGTLVHVALHVSTGTQTLGLEGRVVWRRASAQAFAHGLSFGQLPLEVARQLDELLRPPS